MTEFNLPINDSERAQLLRVLKNSLGETRVEVHHTHTPGYRESVKHEEDVIRGLLQKLENGPTDVAIRGSLSKQGR